MIRCATQAGVGAEMGAGVKEKKRRRDPRHLLPSRMIDAYSEQRVSANLLHHINCVFHDLVITRV